MKGNRILVSIFGLLFIAFLIVYLGGLSGFYEYEQYRRRVLTEEQILAFEEDIREGREIDLTDYITPINRDYHNRISSGGLAISNKLEQTVKTGINVTFRTLSRYINN